jgi:hypothetical protein
MPPVLVPLAVLWLATSGIVAQQFCLSLVIIQGQALILTYREHDILQAKWRKKYKYIKYNGFLIVFRMFICSSRD